MKGPLKTTEVSRYGFHNIPVGSYFIHQDDLKAREIVPYLKISDNSAYAHLNREVFVHPELFSREPIYVIVAPAGDVTWRLA